MQLRRDVFQAISDPTRREILTLLLEEPKNVNSIAETFDLTRQAISLHVKVLHECKIISLHKRGREKICQLNLEKLNEVNEWIHPFHKIWEEQFGKLDNLLKEIKSKSTDNDG